MRTVKEFKDAGVVFVVGDESRHFKVGEPICLNEHGTFDYDVVIKFEWRDLTTKPDNAKFKIELDIANHRWRPSLNQGEEWPDEQRIDVIGQNGNDGLHYDNTAQQFEALASDKLVKQVFTQAMSDAGELPPVGAECIYVFNDDEEYIGEIAAIDGDACWFKLSGFGYKTFIGKQKFKPIIKTIKTIKVNGFDVPAPMSEAPECGGEYFAPQTGYEVFCVKHPWRGDKFDSRFLSRGLVHSNKSAAIAHAKAMLGIDPNA